VSAVLLRGILPFDWALNAKFIPRAAAMGLGYLLLSAGVEELLFRGYGFARLITSIGLWPAQLIVALMYASYQVLNGTSWQAAFAVTVIGSLMFGLVFARTRSVPAAAGFHAATNWARVLVLSDPPSTRSWFGPVAARSWTAHERQTTVIILNLVALVACALLYWSIRRRDRQPLDV
jgi:membrane protease YdiL (CAAX protease family)